eukprot:13779051-Ditylum_brightwellii.AAC.2
MEEQRLWQVQFVKDAKRHAKKHGPSAKEVKDLNTFVKGKIDKTIKQCNFNMHMINNFEDLSIFSTNE